MSSASPSRKHVVGLVGLKNSGKDTLFRIIQQWYPHALRLAFGDPLKEEVYDSLSCEGPFTDKLLEVCRQIDFDVRPFWPTKGVSYEAKLNWIDANKASLRPLLQYWGTEVRRVEDPNYWVRKLDEKVRASDGDLIVITDVRFQNETEYIRAGCGGIIVKVVRTDIQPEEDPHVSERFAREVGPNVVVTNPGTSVDAFIEGAEDLRNYLVWWLGLRGKK